MTKKKAAPSPQTPSAQDLIIRRAEPHSSGRWSVVLPTQDYSGARLVHTASSKRGALEWALKHLTDSGDDSGDSAREEALEVRHVPFPEL